MTEYSNLETKKNKNIKKNSHECMQILIVVASIMYPLHNVHDNILFKSLTRCLVILWFSRYLLLRLKNVK